MVAVWKEVESRIPSIPEIFRGFFKLDDGKGSLVKDSPMLEIKRNEKTMFIQRKKADGKDGRLFFIDPTIDEIDFINENESLQPSFDKKKLLISWKGNMACTETEQKVTCAPSGNDDDAIASLPKKPSFRKNEKVKKVLKREEQLRDEIHFTDRIPLWSEPKTDITDINIIALASGAGLAIGGSVLGYLFPAAAIFSMAAPMLIGAPILANSEAFLRNEQGSWFFKPDLDDDQWFSDIDIDPKAIKSIDIKQDDEYYFHANVELVHPVTCKLMEESDILSYYPERRLKCNGENEPRLP